MVHRMKNPAHMFRTLQFTSYSFFPWYRDIPQTGQTCVYPAQSQASNSQFPDQNPKAPSVRHQHKRKKDPKPNRVLFPCTLHHRMLRYNAHSYRSLPLSRSSSASTSLLITGPAALGSSFVRRAACSWMSSSSSSRNRPWVTGGAAGAEVDGEPEEELPPL
jgi:hypothetical protein